MVAVKQAAQRTTTTTQQEQKKLQEACSLVRLGEMSRARQRLTFTGLAPGNAATLAELTNPLLRPQALTTPIPPAVATLTPPTRLSLDRTLLAKARKSAREGSAPDLSGIRYEHLKVILDDEAILAKLGDMASAMAAGEVPAQIARALGLGRMTALKKDNGKVRGIYTPVARYGA